MPAVAIIPARGGSKGLPRKNVRLLCGKPLIVWTIEAALKAETVGRVVVSTDDGEIAAVSRRYGAEVVRRPDAISGDSSSSEAALLHALEQLRIHTGIVAFLQCTAPLMLAEDIDGTVRELEHADSAFTATPSHRFLWTRTGTGVEPLGHRKTYRPMRQQRDDHYEEVGAVYAMRAEALLRAHHRFPGTTALYPIPAERSVEIDDETDFFIAEALMRHRLRDDKVSQLPAKVEAVVTDFDGVLTDNRVVVDEEGVEAVVAHRGDGWAMQQLKRRGIQLLVLTSEGNPAVRRRCEKLGVDCIVARGEKLPLLREWLQARRIDPLAACYVGNDDPDVACMQFVGCGIAPADAYDRAKQAARIVMESPGGAGCIRELAEMLMEREGGWR